MDVNSENLLLIASYFRPNLVLEKGNKSCLVVISFQVLLRVKPSLSNDLACGFTNRKHGHEINQLDNIVMRNYVSDHPLEI